MDKETRNYAADIEVRDEDGKPPRITGTAVVFNSMSEDLGGFRERIAPDAFDDSLSDDGVAMVWNHDTSQPLARVRAGNLELTKNQKGIRFEATPLDTTVARDAVTNIRGGLIDKMSFGFFAEKDEWNTVNGEEIRTVLKGRLVEVSPVLFPAYTNTKAAVRSLEAARSTRDDANGDPGNDTPNSDNGPTPEELADQAALAREAQL